MKHRTHLAIRPRRVLEAAPAPNLRSLLVLLLTVWLYSPVAIGQCQTVLQSGGPIATLRGQVITTQVWDPDGAGPLPAWLVAGGLGLSGGNQFPVGLLAYDGAQWRGLGFDVNQPVHALAVFNGALIAGGAFTLPTPGGNANSIARWDGVSWQPLGSGVAGNGATVRAMALFGGELVAGGSFATAGGVAAAAVARWNGGSWLSMGPGFSTVNSLEPYFGTLYAGVFSAQGFQVQGWNGTAWAAAANTDGGVTSLRAITGTTLATSFLFAAGDFGTINGVTANRVARKSGSTWFALGGGLPQLSGIRLHARFVQGGVPEVIAAGSTTDNTARVWRWNGSAWSALGNLGPATGTAAATGPQLYGGYVVGLNDANAAPRTPSMYRFVSDWTPMVGKGIPTPVQCLAFDGPDAIAGGAFATIDGVTVNGIARRSGTTWSALGSGMAGGSATVKAVVRAANGEVFAGGSFTTAGGNAASNIARWNGSAWAPLGTGTNGTVAALLITSNGDLIAGGDFTTAGGVACNRIARWNGTAWSQLASGMNNSVRCLVQLNSGEIVAGGTFTVAGGAACSRVALWNGIAWSVMNVGMNGDVNALVLRSNGELIAGGAFTTVGGGSPCLHVARWSGSSWLGLSFGLPDTVNALMALPDGDVLIGGRFATGGFNRLARWNQFNNAISSVGLGVDGPDVLALAAAPNGEFFIGGDFDAILPSQAAGHLAIFTTNCPAQVTPVATSCVGPGGPLSLVANTLPWVGSTFRSTASGFAPHSIAISVLGLTPVNLPLSLVLPIGLPNCDLFASPDELILSVPLAGSSQYQFSVPDNAVFAGLSLSHQFAQLQFAPSGAMLSLSSSNALTLVLGLL